MGLFLANQKSAIGDPLSKKSQMSFDPAIHKNVRTISWLKSTGVSTTKKKMDADISLVPRVGGATFKTTPHFHSFCTSLSGNTNILARTTYLRFCGKLLRVEKAFPVTSLALHYRPLDHLGFGGIHGCSWSYVCWCKLRKSAVRIVLLFTLLPCLKEIENTKGREPNGGRRLHFIEFFSAIHDEVIGTDTWLCYFWWS